MTTTLQPAQAQAQAQQPRRAQPSQTAPVKTRRRGQAIAVGVALIVIGALATYLVFQSLGKTQTVFTAKSDIGRGQVIDAGQLSELQIGSGQAVDGYTPDEVEQLVGQFATVDLPAGSLFTSKNTASSVGVPEGQSMVGVPLKPGQLPSSTLVAGDKVRLVGSQALDASGRQVTDEGSVPVDAIVANVHFDEVANLTVVDVLVPSGKAPDLASRAAGGSLALILDPAE